MFNLPDRYKTDVKVALKDFIPKDLKPNDKKRIKDAVKEVRLVYQIAERFHLLWMQIIDAKPYSFLI